jgi:hypothetical protein
MPFATIPEALDDFRAGKMLVVVDDEDRENEGDLTMAAELVTPEAINFMATHGRGLICLALSAQRCDELGLPLMSAQNTSRFGTAFTESMRWKVSPREFPPPTARTPFAWPWIRKRLRATLLALGIFFRCGRGMEAF